LPYGTTDADDAYTPRKKAADSFAECGWSRHVERRAGAVHKRLPLQYCQARLRAETAQ
jgi:hypothetical protein